MRMKPEDWTDVIATNLSGAFYAIKAVTRPMLKARSGRIVNITQRLRDRLARWARPTTRRPRPGSSG